MEPENTNLFFQMLGRACQMDNGAVAVQVRPKLLNNCGTSSIGIHVKLATDKGPPCPNPLQLPCEMQQPLCTSINIVHGQVYPSEMQQHEL